MAGLRPSQIDPLRTLHYAEGGPSWGALPPGFRDRPLDFHLNLFRQSPTPIVKHTELLRVFRRLEGLKQAPKRREQVRTVYSYKDAEVIHG